MAELRWITNGGNYYYFKDAPTHATGVSLNKNQIVFTTAGQTEQLIATVIPDGAMNKKVIWSSSDTSVATVSQTGLVTCVTPGNAIITVTTEDGGYTATCSVSVKKDIVVDFIVLGGGGGGGKGGSMTQGGGGGAGGLIYCCSTVIVPSASNSVTVGAGGGPGCKGCNSSFLSYTAYGGGNGSDYLTGGSGGSGGGAVGTYSDRGTGGSGTEGQGNNGGGGGYSNQTGAGTGGGGGGAGGAGCSAYTNSGGTGGIGITTDITGTELCMAGGGGGAGYYGGASGSYGGGNGGQQSRGDASYGLGKDATTYGSGGGGGGGCCSWNGGSGCQGIVVVRYLTSCGYNTSGGCKYTCGDYTIHCFTSNGTLCFVQDGTLNMN